MSPAWCFLCFVVLLQCSRNVSAQEEQQDDGCYSPGSIAGIVIATVVVTLVTAALAAAFIWYLWKQRKNGYGEDKAHEKGPPMSPDKQLIVKENSDYAFDNPYFKDDETDHTKHDAAEKGESGFRLDNGDINPSQNNTKANGQAKKNRPFSSLPFHAVFHPSGKKQQQKATMDDTYISKAAERVEVPLRGHDFTGLGFDICGNMRDGIFVKDVLHRGPASESGKIKAGDRIVGVRVSFGAMVYEDALTILSYASPYDVRLELEKAPEPAKRAASIRSQCAGARRLFHPLYRSRSIDDLTQIGKDAYLGTDSPAVPSKSPKEATPKRSQSVEASNGGLKSRVAAFTLIKPRDDAKSRKSSTSSCDSASTKPSTTPLPEAAAEVKEEPVCVKKEVKSSRFRVEQINVKSEAPVKVAPPAKPARDLSEDKLPEKEEEKPQVVDPLPQEQPQPTSETTPPPEDPVPEERPTAPPRKTGTPAKRRAPAPPPTETAVQVHRVQEQTQQQPEAAATEDPEDPPPPPTSAVPEREDAVSMSGSVGEEPSSPGKRKAASLGDLTRLDAKAAAASSAVLERAVSLDLQQSLPGENLVKQQKLILRAPAFEDDYVESKESDLDVQIIQENGLKRWENGLDTVLSTLENGISKHDETEEIDDDDLTLTDTTPVSIATTTDITTTIKTEATGEIQLHQKAKDEDEEVTVIPRTPPAPQKKILTIDLDLNLDSTSSSSSSNTSSPQLTSTPARKPSEPSPEESSSTATSTRVGPPLFPPVSVSIPVIKPDMTHFEKLPSPPGGADPGRRAQLQSLYRPLFGGGDDQQQPPLLANGGSPPNSVAGFAKTLIIPGPNEVDSLLGLASEPNEPPSPIAETRSVDVE